LKNDDSILAGIVISSPCTVSWEGMTGDEQERACQLCQLRVYNISKMSHDEAEIFLRERVCQDVCVRLSKRKDGTIITDECPRSLRKARDLGLKLQIRIVSSVAIFIAWLIPPSNAQDQNSGTAQGNGQAIDANGIVPNTSPASHQSAEQIENSWRSITSHAQRFPSRPHHIMGKIETPGVQSYNSYNSDLQNKIKKVWHKPEIMGEAPEVRFKVDEEGRPSSIELCHSSGQSELDEEVINTLKSLTFTKPPKTLEGYDYKFKFE
jgi:TonB family protein